MTSTPKAQTGIVMADTPVAKNRKRACVIIDESESLPHNSCTTTSTPDNQRDTELADLKREVKALKSDKHKLHLYIQNEAGKRVLLETQSKKLLQQLSDALIVLSKTVLVCMRDVYTNEERLHRRTASLVNVYKKTLTALEIICVCCKAPDVCHNSSEFVEMLRLNCCSTGAARAHWICIDCYALLMPKMHEGKYYKECPQCRGEITGTTATHQDLSPLVVFNIDDLPEFGRVVHDLFEQAQTFVASKNDPLRNCIVATSYMYTAIKHTVAAAVPSMQNVELMRAATDAQHSLFVSFWNNEPMHINSSKQDRALWEMILDKESSAAKKSPLEGIFGETAALCKEALLSNFE